MIGYGIACVLVCALSLFDKRAIPYAIVIFLGWIAGFAGWQYWPLVSLVSASALFWLHIYRPIPVSPAVAALAALMLCADVIYLWFRWQRIPIEVEYGTALNIGLTCQLVLIGHVGAINAGDMLGSWLSSRLRGFRGVHRA